MQTQRQIIAYEYVAVVNVDFFYNKTSKSQSKNSNSNKTSKSQSKNSNSNKGLQIKVISKLKNALVTL